MFADAQQQLEKRMEKRVKALVLSLARADRQVIKLKTDIGWLQEENAELAAKLRASTPADASSFLRPPPPLPPPAPDAATAPSPVGAGELGGLRLSGLRRRAVAAGLCEEDIDAACDEDEPKAALAALLVPAVEPPRPPAAEWLAERLFNAVEVGTQVQPMQQTRTTVGTRWP